MQKNTRLVCKVVISNQPTWLLCIKAEVSLYYAHLNQEDDLETLKRVIDEYVEMYIANGNEGKSVVTTELRRDEGKTILMIKRNQRLVASYMIE